MADVSIVTLGCARNEVDSDQLAGLLARGGHRLVPEPADAAAILVNTCTFIDPATDESIDTVLQACDLKRDGAQAVLVVGCMAERFRDDLARSMPEVDAVVGFGGYPRLPQILDEVLAGRAVERFVGAPAQPVASGTAASSALLVGGATAADELDRIPPSGPRFPLRSAPDQPWAYVKVASGCDRTCTFCAIPSWRGAFRSRPLDEIVDESRWLARNGAREIVLVSENTTSWGKELPGGRAQNQPRLLETLATIDGLERIRLVYLQPDEIRPELLRAMTTIPEVASYFDLSLQHASAPILRRMARTGSRQRFLDLVAEIRERDPRAVFRSNFIVGFPGETAEDVDELASFLSEARLDWVGLFAFSPQEGTRAPDLDGPVPADVAQERLRDLSDLQEVVADEAARTFVGQELEVIVEAEDDGAGSTGRSYREAPETDGEIRLVTPAERTGDARDGEGEIGVSLPVGRTVTAQVVRAVGVDLVAVPELPSAGVGRRRRHLPLVGSGIPGGS